MELKPNEKQVADLRSQLEEKNRELDNLYNHSQVGFWRLDIASGKFLRANKTTAELLGYPDPEALISHCRPAEIEPKNRWDEMLTILEKKGSCNGFELVWAMQQFSRRTLSISANAHPEAGYIEGSLINISHEKNATAELQDTNSELSAAVASLKKTQDQLIQSEKMSSLGSLVAGVAHEINTPVGIAVTVASNLQDKTTSLNNAFASGEMTKSSFDSYLSLAVESSGMILANLHRAAELIKSFKQIAVDQSCEIKRWLNLNDFIQEIATSFRPKFKKTAHQLFIDCAKGIKLKIDAGGLSQVFTNLFANSFLHAFEGVKVGEIKIAVEECGDRVKIRFQDNGIGMSRLVREKIFEAFYTTKRGSGGSGLGLHLVYNLITSKLDGRIQCESTPGIGTTFLITLPINMEEKARTKDKDRPCLGKKILVVDDEETVRTVTKEILKSTGCTVICAGNGDEALEIYRLDAPTIDAVILDMVMPGLSGEQVLLKMRNISCHPNIILASGFQFGSEEAQRMLDEGATGFLTKPFPIKKLKEVIIKATGGDEE